MSTTILKVEAKETDSDNSISNQNVRILEMRIIAQNREDVSIDNPNDKRIEEIKAPFSDIAKLDIEGSLGDLIL